MTVCPFTTATIDAPLMRLSVEPSEQNGLDRPSSLMIDKVTTVPRSSIGAQLGRLSDDQVVQLDRALIVFLGLAS